MKIDYSKYADGLVPAVVQDSVTGKVLMVGFMNEEAVDVTMSSGKVTFYSRSKHRLWTKGETSEHYLLLHDIKVDCDNDTILVKAKPTGPTCHTGADTCFFEENTAGVADFLLQLERVIADRKNNPSSHSYTSQLLNSGINKVAQKVGEEAVELVIEAMDNNEELFLGEAADLLFHYLVLLQSKGYSLSDVAGVLQKRHK